MKLIVNLLLTLILFGGVVFLFSYTTNHGRSLWYPYYVKFFKKSLSDRLNEFSEIVKDRVKKDFDAKGLIYPPKSMTFLALKKEKKFELWASNETNGTQTFIKSYDFTAFSGKLGPKLKEGDRQIPEGFYKIKSLNPNSSYHLSLEVNYPNAYDLKNAKIEKRFQPGSLIYIHGKNVTIGCIPLGDQAIEEVFILSAIVGLKYIELIISPKDFRVDDSYLELRQNKQWVQQLYDELRTTLKNKYLR